MAVQRGEICTLWPVDVRAQNLKKKILKILSTTDSKKKLKIDYKNLEISKMSPPNLSLLEINVIKISQLLCPFPLPYRIAT